MAKKNDYLDFLKESIQQEYDASKMDYLGPLVDPIITYDGDKDKELKTSKKYDDAQDLLEKIYMKELKDARKRIETINEEGDVQEQDPERNEVITGDTPASIPSTVDDVKDEIDDGEKGSMPDDDANYISNESTQIDDDVIARLIAEMEDLTDIPEDEKGGEAGTAVTDEDEIDSLLDEFLLAEDDDADEKKDEEKDEDDNVKPGDETEDSAAPPLDVDKSIKEHHRQLGPNQRPKDEELEALYESFKLQLEQEIEDEETKKEDKDEKKDEDDKDKKEDSDEEISKIIEALLLDESDFIFEDDDAESDEKEDKEEHEAGESKEKEDKEEHKDIDKMIEALIRNDKKYISENIDLFLEDLDFAADENKNENEITTGDEPDAVDPTMDDLEDEINGEEGYFDLDEALFFEDDDKDKEPDEDADDKDEKKEDKDEEPLKESKRNKKYDDIDLLIEDEDLLNEFLDLV